MTGETPTVDLQNVVQQRVMTRDIINAVPAGTKSAMVLGVLIPGVTTISQDVGGTIYGSAAIAIHNSRAQEMQLLHDGMAYNNGQGRGGSFTAIATNDATVAEISLETSGLSAESEVSGIRSNVIPKDGGNTFKGYFFGTFTNHTMQSDNLSDDLKDRGLATVDRVNRIYDIDPALGGPIKKDVLWFYGSVRVWKTEQTIAGMFYNLNPPGSHELHARSEPAGVRRRSRRQPEPAPDVAGLDQAQGHRPAAGQPADSRPFLRPGRRGTGCWRPTRSCTTTRGRPISRRRAGARR